MKLEIYGTLGPSCCTTEILVNMLNAGRSGVRLNLSHGNLAEKKDWIESFHQACQITGIHADFMIDMQGPELRLKAVDTGFTLSAEEEILLDDTILPAQILQQAQPADRVLIDDGKIQLSVIRKKDNALQCKVIYGGKLKPSKSIMIQGKNLRGSVLTDNDKTNLKEAADYGVTAIMQPFVSSQQDLIELKKTLCDCQCDHLKIYAKIENNDGVEHMEELMHQCDCIVIARGDLANACSLTKLPFVQKKIEQLCRKHKQPYMVVTEMLNSMIEHPTPTRAEVSDVFHAVYHGASAIMLTGETASGNYPAEAMNIFVQVAQEALEFLEETKEKNND